MLIPKLEKQIRNEIYCRICGKKKEDPSFLMCWTCWRYMKTNYNKN